MSGRRYFADTGAAGGSGGGQSGAGAGPGAAGSGAAGTGATPVPLAGPDGALAENWQQHEKIPPEHRTNKALAGIKDVGSLVAWGCNLEKVLGKKRAIIPESDQDTAGVDAYFRTVGWPEKPEDYPAAAVAPLPNTPKEMLPQTDDQKKAAQAVEASWRTICHKAHLTAGQFAALTHAIQEQNVADFNAEQQDKAQAMETAQAALRTKWQARYDPNVQLANTAAAAFADAPLLARLQAKGFLEDPDFLEYSVNVGQAVSPDRLHARSDGSPDAGGIQAKIEELETSQAYRKSEHPRHDAVTNEVLRLREQLHNTKR